MITCAGRRTTVLGVLALDGPSEARWNALACAAGNVFATRTWAQCWVEVFAPRGRPLVLVDGADPRIVVPLYLGRGPAGVRLVRFLGHGPADQLGPACAAADLRRAAELVRDALRPRRDWDVLLAQDVLVEQDWPALLGGATAIRTVSSPAVTLPAGSWDDFLRQRSKNFREQLRRRERKLSQRFDVQARLSCADTLSADLDEFFRLHRLRWGAGAPLATGDMALFQRRFAEAALAAGWLRLWTLRVNGRAAASSLGFRIGGVESFYLGGRDPADEEHSVGSVLMGLALRSAVEDGMTEYRLLRGDEAYKSRLADIDRTVHTVARPRGLRGRIVVEGARRRSG